MTRARRLRLLLILALILATAPRLAGAAQQDVAAPEGWIALERGDATRAAAVFREALERRPRDPLLHLGAGWAAFALGRHDAAISSLKKALEYNPSLLQAAALLAQVAYASSDLELAIRSLEKAAAMAPNNAAIRRQLEQWRKEAALHASFDERPGLRFKVMYEGTTQRQIGERVAGVLESAYWTIGKTLNSYPGEALTVVLYTNRQFQDVTRAPAWAGGGYDGRIRLAVGGALRTPAALDRVVRHELVHAMIANVAPRNVPTWVNEGLASVLDSDDRAWARRTVARSGEFIPLEDLDGGFGNLDGTSAMLAYAESAIAAEILVERLGPNLGVFLQMLGSGHTVDQALGTLNVQAETFYAEWRRRVGAP